MLGANARFTTVLIKPLCVRRVQRYVCVNLLNPTCIQPQFSSAMYIVHTTNATQCTLKIAHKGFKDKNSLRLDQRKRPQIMLIFCLASCLR